MNIDFSNINLQYPVRSRRLGTWYYPWMKAQRFAERSKRKLRAFCSGRFGRWIQVMSGNVFSVGSMTVTSRAEGALSAFDLIAVDAAEVGEAEDQITRFPIQGDTKQDATRVEKPR